jgi:hypothetical protein
MMGQQRRTESLFCYFRLEEQIPSDHLLRMIGLLGGLSDQDTSLSVCRLQVFRSKRPAARTTNEIGFCSGASVDEANVLRMIIASGTRQSLDF